MRAAAVAGVSCPCFSIALARLVVRTHQLGISTEAPANDYCLSQPRVVGSIHAGLSDFTSIANLGVTRADVSQSAPGVFQCEVSYRHRNTTRTFTTGVSAEEKDACVDVMLQAIALEDTNDRCNKNYLLP